MQLPEDPLAPEIQSPQPEEQPTVLAPPTFALAPDPWETRAVRWMFLSGRGLRAGWSVLSFAFLFFILLLAVGSAFFHLHLISEKDHFSAGSTFFSELISFMALAGAASVMALIDLRRSLLAFNLTGPRRIARFFSGLAAGFAALSALVGLLAWGGWLHFGPVALSGTAIFRFGALWAAAFLLVSCVEEGVFRCYLQFTLTRGINFWWALSVVGLLCLGLLLLGKGNGIQGIFAVALLGFFPCLTLHIRKTPGSGFWQAAWVTSTLFGAIHTSNHGENWIGIFAAALIGFVFCASVRLTGSAWWAIGCHASWDWAETYFYGTADSGNVAVGHYLTTAPAGNALWSGGANGPEGSLLVIAVALLLLASLVVIYGRGNSAAEQAMG